MKILIAGISGFTGSALKAHFKEKSYEVEGLSRHEISGNYPYWDIEKGIVNFKGYEDADVVINLAGEGIQSGRWTPKKKQRLEDSRIKGTRMLANYMGTLQQKPKLFISASAIGIYGNQGDVELPESYPTAEIQGYLPGLCRSWEAASLSEINTETRVVNPRIGIVLDRSGGALEKMTLPFKLGLGGVFGKGTQWMSWISLQDFIKGIDHIIENPNISGPVNFVSPTPITNRDFTKALGQAFKRPTPFPLPEILIKLIFGEMGEVLFLHSARVLPERLQATGFEFENPTLQNFPLCIP